MAVNCRADSQAFSIRGGFALAVMAVVGLYLNDGLLRFAAKRNPGTRVHFLLTTPPRKDAVAVLGSSMLANAISTQQLSQAIDGDTIQLAVGGQGLQEQALIWELYLSRHRCDLLALELHSDSLRAGTLPAPLREDRYAAHIDHPIVKRHLKDYSGTVNAACWRHVPMWAFAEFNSKIGWHDWLGYLKGSVYDPDAPPIYSRPGEPRPQLETQPRPQQQAAAPKPLDPSAIKSLRSILTLAERAGVRILLIEPPRFGGSHGGAIQVPSAAHPRAAALIAKRFQFSPSAQDNASLFDDERHASAAGATQFTRELAEHILSNP